MDIGTVKHSFLNEYRQLKTEREVPSVAFLLKSCTSVKSALLETPWMIENSKERGARGRKGKPEKP